MIDAEMIEILLMSGINKVFVFYKKREGDVFVDLSY